MSPTEEWRVRGGFARSRRLVMTSLLSILLLGIFLSPYAAQAQDATKLVGGDIATFAGSTNPNAPSGYDNIPADGSQIAQPASTFVDQSGNVYFSSLSNPTVWVIYGGTTVPPILALRVPNPTKGNLYVVAGSLGGGSPCSGGPCGDGGSAIAPATNPDGSIPESTLGTPSGIVVDATGNLYVADQSLQSIRKVDATSGNISTIAGDPNHTLSGYSGDSGPATSAILFDPAAVVLDNAGNIYIADSVNALIRRIDGPKGANPGQINAVAGNVAAATAANGTGSPPPDCATTTDTCGEGGPPLSATLGYVAGMSFDTQGNLFIAEADTNTIREIDFSSTSPVIHTVAGTLRSACSPPSCGDGGSATSAQLNGPFAVVADANGNLVISDQADNAVRLVTKNNGNIQTIAGQISATGSYGGDNGPATSAMLNAPWGVSLDTSGNLYIADQLNALIREVTPAATRKPQTITYSGPASVMYGSGPLDLSKDFEAIDPSTNLPTGLSISSFALGNGSPATLSGSTLTVTGTGNISITATQNGDTTWAPATLTQSITAMPATLTVTASNLTLLDGAAIPATFSYTFSGFVGSDTQTSVVTGTPSFAVVNSRGVTLPAGTVPAAGTYNITITKNTLSAGPNYTLNFVDGTLLVTQGQSQKVTISNFTSPTTYGAPNSSFSFTTTASSGLPVSVTFTGPVKTQQTTSGWSVTVVGAGQVTITATQAGNTNYAPATATESFIVNPAPLTITANNAQMAYGSSLPTFSYTASGFVNNDNTSVLSGTPVYSTTATSSSAPGQYPIQIAQGTLFAQNYSFVLKSGTLTVTPASQTITFAGVQDTPYNVAETVAANASSGLPVTYSVSGPVSTLTGQGPNGTVITVTPTDVGLVTITANQSGNQDYSPAPPATVSFNVVKAEAQLSPISVSRPVGAPNPTFQFQISLPQGGGGLIDPIAPPYFTGAPDISTTATESSPPGQYPITATQGTLAAEHYYFVFNQGTLTVTSASSYILTTTPTAITIPRGQSRQISVLASPVNNYAGNVTLGCTGLPAGVSCSFSPAALTIQPPSGGIASAQPVQGTLTITAAGGNASLEPLEIWRKGSPLAAGSLLLPGMTGGMVLLFGRRRFLKNVRSRNGLALLVLFCVLGALAACGGGSSSSSQAQPGTTMIQVTGSGSAADGAADLSQTVSLSVTIQ